MLIATVFTDRTLEIGYPLDKLKLSWKVLINRTGGKAEKNIYSIMSWRSENLDLSSWNSCVFVFWGFFGGEVGECFGFLLFIVE